MGREIRRVPTNWQHPKETRYDPFRRVEHEAYTPMYDQPYIEALTRWVDGWMAWDRGEFPDYASEECKATPYWDYEGGPPQPEIYRPNWADGEATWYQVYETVSEGTPVTPPFETKQELIDYLVENGDFWDQKRRKEGCSGIPCAPWPRKQAEAFVNGPGWAPSMVVSDGKVMSGVEFVTNA